MCATCPTWGVNLKSFQVAAREVGRVTGYGILDRCITSFVSFTPPRLALSLFGQGRAPHFHAVLLLNVIRGSPK